MVSSLRIWAWTSMVLGMWFLRRGVVISGEVTRCQSGKRATFASFPALTLVPSPARPIAPSPACGGGLGWGRRLLMHAWLPPPRPPPPPGGGGPAAGPPPLSPPQKKIFPSPPPKRKKSCGGEEGEGRKKKNGRENGSPRSRRPLL